MVSDQAILKESITLGQHNNSLNFAFGFATEKTTPGEEDLDILNNPYVDIIPYRMSVVQGRNIMSLLPRDAIGPCSAEDLVRYLPKKHFSWYP